jgi:type IV pilus assembly protein PilQ
MQQEKYDAQQSAASVSPATPGGSLSNAYQKEIMIGTQGRTIDPQAAFGSGGGSRSPAGQFGMATGFMYDAGSATSSQFTGARMSLDLENADLHSVFRLISHVSDLNIVTSDDITGKVTVRLEDVPWDQALAAILRAKGLGSERFGNIIRVAPLEQIKVEKQAALETKRAQEDLVDLQLLVIPLDYAQASELQSQVRALLSSRGTLQVDTRGNQLILKDTEQKLAQIRELIRHLDKSTPQVLIEARVVEASSTFSRNLGIQWGANLHANPGTGYSTGLFFPNSVGITGGRKSVNGAAAFYSANADIGENLMVDLGAEASTSAVSINLGSIPGLIDIDARLSAMETDGFGKVVSEPRITTMDNKEAKISQGARIPYLSTSSGGTQVQFVMAALEMSVTPHITSKDQISLSISISNNRPDFANLVQGQPAIQIKEAKTSILVADGDTTVIGGVFASESAKSRDLVPGLSKIPLLGYLFQNYSNTVTRNEMLVFITPHIVTREATK